MIKISEAKLKEVILPSAIKVKVNVDDCRSAIFEAGSLLVKNNIVEQSYVDAMIQSFTELGPYIVLVPGVAVPHARPEAGAKKMGASVVTLQKKLLFGHKENDPVHTVIAFASDNDTNHIDFLKILSEFLMDSERVKKMETASSVDEVIALLSNADE